MRDQTERMQRHLAGRLHPGEQVLAGVALSLPGTAAASMSGAAAASDGLPSVGPDGPLAHARDGALRAGLGRGPHYVLVLTSQRLELVRRTAFGRPKEPVLSVPLSGVTALSTSTQGQAVQVDLVDGTRLRLETPKAFRFLPPVYSQLPATFAAARGAS